MSSGEDIADAVVIGSGPNGLVAAITLARAGWDVTVLERAPVAGGAVQTASLTQPGFLHDPYSAFYGLLHAAPVFAELELDRHVRWARFETVVSAAINPHTAAHIHADPERTASALETLHRGDGDAWRALMDWWRTTGSRFFATTIAPLPAAREGLRFARATGLRGLLPQVQELLAPIEAVAHARLGGNAARVLLASGISHTDLSVDATASAPASLFLAMLAQHDNMPVPVGGAGELTRALTRLLTEAGGTIRLGDAATRVVTEHRRARAVETAAGHVVRARHAVLADTGPLALCRDLVGEQHFPPQFLDGLRRFRYGTGIFKVDCALSGPVPWIAEGLDRSGVVHLTGGFDDMARASYEARRGLLPARPMLIVGQQSVADSSRAPAGCHTLWIETHVPSVPRGDGAGSWDGEGWTDARGDFLARVLARIEEHAPGFTGHISGTATRTPDELASENPNLVGGDIGGGSGALDQQLVFRPVPGWFRYRTPVRGLYLCSASTHPGGGVHGMCGRNCARRVISDSRRPAGVLRTATGSRRRAR